MGHNTDSHICNIVGAEAVVDAEVVLEHGDDHCGGGGALPSYYLWIWISEFDLGLENKIELSILKTRCLAKVEWEVEGEEEVIQTDLFEYPGQRRWGLSQRLFYFSFYP